MAVNVTSLRRKFLSPGDADIAHLETGEQFLRLFCRFMPRTMLRYAIEKVPERKRRDYLHGRLSLERKV